MTNSCLEVSKTGTQYISESYITYLDSFLKQLSQIFTEKRGLPSHRFPTWFLSSLFGAVSMALDTSILIWLWLQQGCISLIAYVFPPNQHMFLNSVAVAESMFGKGLRLQCLLLTVNKFLVELKTSSYQT